MNDTIKRETVCSGIRPTGNLHLGNYFGALRNFVRMQEEHDCYFFIADRATCLRPSSYTSSST